MWQALNTIIIGISEAPELILLIVLSTFVMGAWLLGTRWQERHFRGQERRLYARWRAVRRLR